MSEVNDWFLSLPEVRQAVLRDDKWLLAEAAFAAGKAARAQPAQAGQVLTDDFIKAEALEAFDCYWDADDETLVNKYGHGVYLSRFIDFARAIEQVVLAKRVPMTPKTLTLEQCVTFAKLAGIKLSPAQFSGVLEAEVSEFELQTFANLCVGIVGEKGGA